MLHIGFRKCNMVCPVGEFIYFPKIPKFWSLSISQFVQVTQTVLDVSKSPPPLIIVALGNINAQVQNKKYTELLSSAVVTTGHVQLSPQQPPQTFSLHSHIWKSRFQALYGNI